MLDDPELALDAIRIKDTSAHRGVLQSITENPYKDSEAGDVGKNGARRQRFLNHLLARFAEQFTDYSLVLYGLSPQSEHSAQEKLLKDKQAFLQNYPQISSARGGAFDYLQHPGPANRAGLEQRIRLKLGLDADEKFYLVEHILLRPIAGDAQQQAPLLAHVDRKDPYSLQLSLVFPEDGPDAPPRSFRRFVERTVREETPAHLTVYIHWLDGDAMENFEKFYYDWLDKLRDFWREELL